MESSESISPKPSSALKRPGSAARRVLPSSSSTSASNAQRNPSPQQQQQQQAKKPVTTLWDVIKEEQKKPNTTLNQSKEPTETNVLVIGPENSGKTSLIYRIIQKDFRKEEPEPTFGLEYRFRKKEDNFKSVVANFWELAGGRTLINLLDDLITPENIHTFVVVIVVDLSKPEQCLSDSIFYLNKVQSIAQECFKVMRQKGSDFPDKLIARQQKRVGEKHADIKQMELSGIQTIFCATHFDSFKMKEPAQLTAMNQWLRYIAHRTGSSIIYMSNINRDAATDAVEAFKSNDTFDKSFRSLMNMFIFNSTEKQLKSVEKLKPVRVLTGKDSFAEIGKPLVSQKSMDYNLKENYKRLIIPHLTTFKDVSTFEGWYALLVEQFGYETLQEKQYNLLDMIAEQYKEPGIDSMRAQKDEELSNYRIMMEQERQKKMAALAELKQKGTASQRPTQFTAS